MIAGTHGAEVVYPDGGGLVAADVASRGEAKKALERLKPKGGTAIGSWLGLAAHVFSHDPDAIHHAILLTDGQNEHESVATFERRWPTARASSSAIAAASAPTGRWPSCARSRQRC